MNGYNKPVRSVPLNGGNQCLILQVAGVDDKLYFNNLDITRPCAYDLSRLIIKVSFIGVSLSILLVTILLLMEVDLKLRVDSDGYDE